LVIVHLKVADVPGTKPVTPDVADVGVVIVAVPETTVHCPVIQEGTADPLNVAVVAHAVNV
jgi:hypothetical protein